MKIKLLFFGLICIAILFSYTSYKVISQTNVTDTTNENSTILTDSSTSKLELISLNDTILEQIIHKPLTLYRALNFNKDTTVWDTSDCKIGKSTFSCNHIERHNYSFGVRDDIRLEIFGDKFKKRSSHKKIIYDTTYIDINFGKNALVHYTPIAEIPKLDRDAVAKALSKLSGKRCSQIFEFRSNYNLEVIGLSGFSWKNRKDEILGYDAYIDRNDSDQEMCSVQGSRDQYTMSSHYSLIYRKSLPEQLDDKRLQFFNGTLKTYQDTTISWKLVYTDQYHRADTLNITTKFENDEADSLSNFRNKACYDAINPSNCK